MPQNCPIRPGYHVVHPLTKRLIASLPYIAQTLRTSPKFNTLLDMYIPFLEVYSHSFRDGREVGFYSHVPSILRKLRNSNIIVVMVSDYPDFNRRVLSLLKMPPNGETAEAFFDSAGPSGIWHFQGIQRKTGLSFSDMLYFTSIDIYSTSIDIEGDFDSKSWGVTVVPCFSSAGGELGPGLTRGQFEEGMNEWRRRPRPTGWKVATLGGWMDG
jgi:hypothetical protein